MNELSPELNKAAKDIGAFKGPVDAAARSVQQLESASGVSLDGLAGDLARAGVAAQNAQRQFDAMARVIGSPELTRAAFPELAAEVDRTSKEFAELRTAASTSLNVVETQANQASTSMRRLGNDVGTSGGKMKSAMGGIVGSLSPVALGWEGVGLAAVLAARQCFNAASDMVEAQNKVDAVFGKTSETIRTWADDAATSMGLSERAALQAAGTFGNMLTAMEMSQPAAAQMSMSIVQLAADLGSFNNIGTAEALEKIRAGLVGETEPLRSLGVNLSAATIEAKALEMGLAGTSKELTAAHKAQAAYALILEQTKTAQGDFARNADEAANSLKIAQASIEDAQVAIGQGLVPVVALLAQNFADVIVPMTNFVSWVNELGGAVPGVTGEMGLLSTALDSLMAPVNVVISGTQLAGDGFGWLKDQMGLTKDEGSQIIPVIYSMVDAIQEASGKGTIFAEVLNEIREAQEKQRQELEKLHATGAQDYATDLERLARNGRDAQIAQNAHREAVEQASEAIRRGYGELTEFASAGEMVADSVEKANQALAYLGEASRLAIQGQANLNTQWTVANERVSFWENNLKNAESALGILDAEMERNGSLTADQQRAYDILTQASERYAGGIRDEQGAVVDAAVAQAEYIAALDALNKEFDGGKENPAEYARRMAEIVAQTDPAAASSYGMAAAQRDLQTAIEGSINKLGNLLIDLGLLPESKRTEFSTPGAAEAQQAMDDLKAKADNVPSSLTITAHVDIAAAQNALNELRGMTFTQSPPKKGPMAFVPKWDYLFETMPEIARRYGGSAMETLASFLPMTMATSGPLTRPANWDFLFADLDRAAEDYGSQAADTFVGFFKGKLTDLASGDMLADAQAGLSDLLTIRQIALDSNLGADIIAGIDAQIATAQAELDAISAAMKSAVVQGIADALQSGEIAEELAAFRQDVMDAFDMGDPLGNASALEQSIAELQAKIAAAQQLGDAALAESLAAQLVDLQAQLVLTNQILETDAVQAWIAWQDQVAAAEEAAEALKQKHEELIQSYYDAITAMSQGGATTADYLAGLVADYEAAKDALRWGELLNLPPEVLAQLQADLDEAGQLLETGSVYLVKALREGLIDEETLRALAETGGEWFRALYDSLFGDGALAAIEDGWNDLSDTTLAGLQQLFETMEDGGASLMQPLIDAVTSGAVSYEDALGLLSNATGEQVNEMIAELERLQAALVVQLAEAWLAGTDPTAIEANLAIIEQLLASLADRAVETAETVVQSGKAMAAGFGDAASGLDGLQEAIREADQAAQEAAAAPIVEAWENGTITLQEARAALDALNEGLDQTERSAGRAGQSVSRMSKSLETIIGSSFIFAGNERHGPAWVASFDQNLATLIERFQAAMAVDPESFIDGYLKSIEAVQSALARATALGEDETVRRYTQMLETMKQVAARLGIDIGKALAGGVNDGLTAGEMAPPSVLRGDYIKDPVTGILRPATAKERAQYGATPTQSADVGDQDNDAALEALRQSVADGMVIGWRKIQTGARPTSLVGG